MEKNINFLLSLSFYWWYQKKFLLVSELVPRIGNEFVVTFFYLGSMFFNLIVDTLRFSWKFLKEKKSIQHVSPSHALHPLLSVHCSFYRKKREKVGLRLKWHEWMKTLRSNENSVTLSLASLNLEDASYRFRRSKLFKSSWSTKTDLLCFFELQWECWLWISGSQNYFCHKCTYTWIKFQ